MALQVMHIEKIPKIVADKFLQREFETSTTIKHKYVLEVYDIIRSNHCFYIFMEFAPGGSLQSYVKKGPLKEDKTRYWFKQCTEGLDCMHNKYKICHRDIKPDNVLLDANENCKLSDFGFAKTNDEEDSLTGTICGTLPFEAPELINGSGKKYNPFAVDVWAMGVMLYQLLNGDFPFKFPPKGTKDKEGMKVFLKKQMKSDFKHKDGVVEKLSIQVQDLCKKCLNPNPETRYTTQRMLKHGWLNHG